MSDLCADSGGLVHPPVNNVTLTTEATIDPRKLKTLTLGLPFDSSPTIAERAIVARDHAERRYDQSSEP